MLDRSLECPSLTTMVVPSPYGLVGDAFVRSLIADGYLGLLREVHVTGLSSDLADPATPLGWRQMTKYSGFNMLQLGILHESVMRWTPPVRRVIASASKLIPTRIDPETGQPAKVGTADSVQVLTGYQGGARGTYRLSGVVWHSTGSSVALFGSEGTLVYDLKRDELRGANAARARPEADPDPRGIARRLAGRGRLHRRDPRRAARHPDHLRRRRRPTCSSPRPSPGVRGTSRRSTSRSSSSPTRASDGLACRQSLNSSIHSTSRPSNPPARTLTLGSAWPIRRPGAGDGRWSAGRSGVRPRQRSKVKRVAR